MTDTDRTIDLLIRENRLNEALAAIDSAVTASPEVARFHYLRGKILWRLGRRTEAMSAYLEAEALDPSSPAAEALRHANDIMEFMNPDLYNP